MQKLTQHFKRRAKQKPRHSNRRRARQALFTAAAISFGMFSSARAETAPARALSPDSQPLHETAEARLARWQESFDAFAADDRAHAPRSGGVLFVGSSSIRLWDSLETDFQTLPIVTKRGFGGSRLSDVSDEVARLVLPYQPATVIVYAGDNDLAEGASPEDVAASFRHFVESVRSSLPNTRIAYLSIKPSPSRAALIKDIQKTNSLIATYSGTVANLDYIDIYSKMLDPNGQPRSDLFRPDMLHLNPAGYAIWRREISSHLGLVTPPSGTGVAGAARASTVAASDHARAAP